MTSHDVVGRVRRVYGTRRVGHTGTLDPLATGVLVVCIGRATRLVEYVVGRPKTYLATVRLGQATNTYDAEGEITAERPLPPEFPLQTIEETLEQFRGEIKQLPPMYSAIKKDGQPLYKLARQGKEVEREPRAVTVYNLQILGWEQPDLHLLIRCSAGTYIRSIAHDLGEVLGFGGYLTMLRRTAVGAFTLDTAVPLDQLTPENAADHLQTADLAVTHLPRLDLPDEQVQKLYNGQLVSPTAPLAEQELLRVYDSGNNLAGLVTVNREKLRAKKMFIPPFTLS